MTRALAAYARAAVATDFTAARARQPSAAAAAPWHARARR